MLCSNCSAPVKPVVAIDIDGTIADYHGHFVQFAEDWLAIRIFGSDSIRLRDMYDGSEKFSEWFCRNYGVDLTTFRKIKLAYRQGGMKRTIPIYPGGRLFVEDIQALGAEIWMTTTRPHDRYDRVDPDTREFLRRHGIEFDGLLFNENKMGELAERIDPARVVAVVDDQIDILVQAERRGWAGILRRTRYNQGVTGWDGLRAQTLAEAVHIVEGLITKYERKNG